MTTDPQTCPNCQHPQHLPGTECQTQVSHGPNRWHLCLCLARPGAALPCPPQMTCQGGTLGYADVWYLQQGHTLVGADGEISPEVLTTGPVSVGFPSALPAVSSAVPATTTPAAVPVCKFDEGCHRVVPCDPGCGAPTLRNRIAAAVDEGFRLHAELEDANLGDSIADSVLGVLPPPADRAATAHSSRAAEAELYVLLRKAGEGRHEAQALIDRHRDEVLRRLAAETDGPCVCGEPSTSGTVHRTDGPCYVAEAQQPEKQRASTWGVCDGCGAAAGPDCDCPPDTGDDHSCADSGCTGEPPAAAPAAVQTEEA